MRQKTRNNKIDCTLSATAYSSCSSSVYITASRRRSLNTQLFRQFQRMWRKGKGKQMHFQSLVESNGKSSPQALVKLSLSTRLCPSPIHHCRCTIRWLKN